MYEMDVYIHLFKSELLLQLTDNKNRSRQCVKKNISMLAFFRKVHTSFALNASSKLQILYNCMCKQQTILLSVGLADKDGNGPFT